MIRPGAVRPQMQTAVHILKHPDLNHNRQHMVQMSKAVTPEIYIFEEHIPAHYEKVNSDRSSSANLRILHSRQCPAAYYSV